MNYDLLIKKNPLTQKEAENIISDFLHLQHNAPIEKMDFLLILIQFCNHFAYNDLCEHINPGLLSYGMYKKYLDKGIKMSYLNKETLPNKDNTTWRVISLSAKGKKYVSMLLTKYGIDNTFGTKTKAKKYINHDYARGIAFLEMLSTGKLQSYQIEQPLKIGQETVINRRIKNSVYVDAIVCLNGKKIYYEQDMGTEQVKTLANKIEHYSLINDFHPDNFKNNILLFGFHFPSTPTYLPAIINRYVEECLHIWKQEYSDITFRDFMKLVKNQISHVKPMPFTYEHILFMERLYGIIPKKDFFVDECMEWYYQQNSSLLSNILVREMIYKSTQNRMHSIIEYFRQQMQNAGYENSGYFMLLQGVQCYGALTVLLSNYMERFTNREQCMEECKNALYQYFSDSSITKSTENIQHGNITFPYIWNIQNNILIIEDGENDIAGIMRCIYANEKLQNRGYYICIMVDVLDTALLLSKKYGFFEKDGILLPERNKIFFMRYRDLSKPSPFFVKTDMTIGRIETRLYQVTIPM